MPSTRGGYWGGISTNNPLLRSDLIGPFYAPYYFQARGISFNYFSPASTLVLSGATQQVLFELCSLDMSSTVYGPSSQDKVTSTWLREKKEPWYLTYTHALDVAAFTPSITIRMMEN